MMKLKYSICCGLDVHKNIIVATIVITNKDGISEYKQKSFSTISSDIQRFHNWIIRNNCYHICTESTGEYGIPMFNYLENDMDVCFTHPKYVKAIKDKKTDKKDSKWIADLYKFDLVRSSFIPLKDFCQLRELARYRFKLVCMKSCKKNRIQNCMTISNIGIANVLSDSFGKTTTEIMSYLLTGKNLSNCQIRQLPETDDGTVCPCHNQEHSKLLLTISITFFFLYPSHFLYICVNILTFVPLREFLPFSPF